MSLIDLSVDRPVTIWVGVILVLLFGTIALVNLPIQMRPTVDKPEITVETNYPGAAPPEVEQQITNKLEEQLASVEDLKRITSTSRESRSEIRLEFDWGVDKDLASINALKKLNLVEDLPDDAKESIIKAVSSDEENPIMWIFAEQKPGAKGRFDVFAAYRFCDEKIRPRLERTEGVGDIWLFGGPEREIRVVIDYERMSAFGITIAQIGSVLQRENLNVRGGPLERGKRRETARTVGQFRTVDDVANVIVAYRNGRPIYIRDFARVLDSYKEQIAAVRQSGQDTCVVGIIRKTGTNTLEVVERVERELDRINREMLANMDFNLKVIHSDSEYIYESIENVVKNVIVGAFLATAVLVLFLRSARSTVIIVFSIPLSLIATFIFIYAFGRTVNIVSLAGLGFAVGMVVDNAIVVLENSFRHMEEGEGRDAAARNATHEVWGAVLSSTLTTMAVFLPIVFLTVEAGQLFKDIAIAVACAVGFSLIVSMTLVPMLCSRWLKVDRVRGSHARRAAWHTVVDWVTFVWVGHLVYGGINRLAAWVLRGTVRKIAVILLIFAPCAVIFWKMRPPLDYLPTGNRNFVFGLVFNPPGTNIEKAKALCRNIEAEVRDLPEVKVYFTVALIGFRDTSFVGIQLKDEYRGQIDRFVGDLQRKLMFSVPGLRFPPGVWFFKMSVFREAMGGKSVDVNIRGSDLSELAGYAAEVEGQLRGLPGVSNVQNSLDIGNPERRIIPNRERAADLGFNVADISDVVQTLVGGKIVDTFKEGGDEYDLTLIGTNHDIRSEEDLRNVILESPTGRRVTLRDLADVVYAEGPTKIEHIDQDRSVTLTVQVEPSMPLQTVVGAIEQQVVEPLRGRLPTGYTVSLYGAADRLQEALRALIPSIALAVLITYLLMAALFESFVYPFVIMFTVPLSWAGALLGIWLMKWLNARGIVPGVPEFNVITLLGFVILTGVVVNNAILIVHQALNLRRAGHSQTESVAGSVRQRIRPIFMSTTTSVLGMLPLAVGGGSGTELYTGLGAAVVGGLMFATIFTLILVPAAFALFLDLRRSLRVLLRLEAADDDRVPVVPERV